MSVDFEKIPVCVFELFDKIMADPAIKAGRTVKCSNRANALIIAWGWQPPLLQPQSETLLTQYGLAAYAWREEQLKVKPNSDGVGREVPLLERVLAVLTPNQGRIMTYLWGKKTASYDILKTIPRAWQDVPSDEAITAALKKMRTRLDANNLSVVSIAISDAGRRVNLDRPPE